MVVLVSLNIYGYSPKMEMPILVIEAGLGGSAAMLFEVATSGSGIPLEWIDDLRVNEIGLRYPQENSIKVKYGNIESGKYKTAIFVFGTLSSGRGTTGPYLNTAEIIREVEAQVELCKKMGIKTLGINYMLAKPDKPWDKAYTTQVLEIIGSKMDLLILKDENSEMDKLFLDIASQNNVEYVFLDIDFDFELYYELYPDIYLDFDNNFRKLALERKEKLILALKEIFGIE